MPKQDASRKKQAELSKRQEIRARRKREEQRHKLIPILLIALAAVAIVVIVVTQYGQTQSVARPNVNGLAMGNPEAPVKVEEFADFQCPSCGYFVTDTEPIIIKNYIATGKVYFEFHNLAFLGNESIAAAEAAYCANDQGKFWEYHDMIFKNQRGENQGWFTTARLTAFAKDVGLNIDTFTECFSSRKHQQKVVDDRAYADSKNITRTPSFLVNGQLTYADSLVKVIESQLASK